MPACRSASVAPAMSAQCAAGVAALPLVGEVDRPGAGPGARVGGQRLAVRRAVAAGVPAGGRVDRHARVGTEAARVAARVLAVTSTHDRVTDVAAGQDVLAVATGDVDAVGAVVVAALPLVGVADRACRPSVPGSAVSVAVLERARDGREDPCWPAGAAWAGAVWAEPLSGRCRRRTSRSRRRFSTCPMSLWVQRVGRVGRPEDVGAGRSVIHRSAATGRRKSIGVGARPAAGVGGQRVAVERGARDRRRVDVRRGELRAPRPWRCEAIISLSAALVAVTTTTMAPPMSAETRSYVAPVAPAMSAQIVPPSVAALPLVRRRSAARCR